MKNRVLPILVFATLFVLGACEGTKEQLGLARTAPDEFAVVKRAPLEMPPDYTLRPPRPGAVRPQEAATDREAAKAIFGTEQQTSSVPEDGEAALLQKAGTQNVMPGIREQVDHETSVLAPHEKPVAERLLGWTTGGNEPPATVVDAEAEAERLKKNVEEGKPVTEGETPYIEE